MQGLHQRVRFLLVLALTGAVVGPLLLLGRASAVSLDTECPPAIRQGEEAVCELTLRIQGGERIPIQSLELELSGPTQLRAQFDPSGVIIIGDAQIQSIELLSTRNPGLGFGYGYGYGSLSGFDEVNGYRFDFGFGYGFGYGYGNRFVSQEFKYSVVLNTAGTDVGDYSARFVVNTGYPDESTFQSDSVSLKIRAPKPTPVATATPTPTATPLPIKNATPTFDLAGSNLLVANSGLSSRVAWGDYDNDGDLDLYVARDNLPNLLLQTDADGTFSNVAEEAGVADSGRGRMAAWADYDSDGNLDLYVANFGPGNTISNPLYRNNGDGTFIEVGQEAGVADQGQAQGIAWADYDNDGDQDLFVANRDEASRLYQNGGDGTFTDVTVHSGVTMDTAGGVAWGDYDSDGDLDLFVTGGDCCEAGKLLVNDGSGRFTVALSLGSGIGGVAWGDYDNDGDLDLYQAQAGNSNLLWNNRVDGAFTDVATHAGVAGAGDGAGVAWEDYDGDGDLDLAVANDASAVRNRLYENNGNANNSLLVRTVGTKSNRNGIGARVRVVAGGLTQVR